MKAQGIIQEEMNLVVEEPVFPSTRFQGSKRKIADWIWESIKNLKFNSALDAFGGTGCIAYMLKSRGKQVTYNDILKFNYLIGLALIENDNIRLEEKEIRYILNEHPTIAYPTFIADNFKGIYYTDEENRWLDVVSTNIRNIGNIYKQALAYFALFQAAIIKRPFNLFHRKNLYLRFSDVERNFGNKVTWDTPFDVHFRKFVNEANLAVFSNKLKNRASNLDVFGIDNTFDLIYVDTPYISNKGIGVDYLGFYHFLEGLIHYTDWNGMIDRDSKHRRLKPMSSVWTSKDHILSAFDRLIAKYKDSLLVVSYRSDGIPTIEEILGLLEKYKNYVQCLRYENYKYALSNSDSHEMLFIAA